MDENNKIMISIIMPVYNVEKYVAGAIRSVLDQTYSCWELICIDDGATDRSGEICDQYAEIDTRIQVYHKKNGGLSDARNYGMEKCSGKYIAFLDSDDKFEESFLENMLKLAEEHKADIVQCDFARIRDDVKHIYNSKERVECYTGKEALCKIYDVEGTQPSVPYTVVWNKLYLKTIIKDLKFPVGRLYEDQYFTYKCFMNADRVVVTNQKMYLYTIRTDSITSSLKLKGIEDILDAHIEQINYLEENRFKKGKDMVLGKLIPLIISFYFYLYEFGESGDYKEIKKYIQYAGKRYFFSRDISMKNKGRWIIFSIFPALYYLKGLNID